MCMNGSLLLEESKKEKDLSSCPYRSFFNHHTRKDPVVTSRAHLPQEVASMIVLFGAVAASLDL